MLCSFLVAEKWWSHQNAQRDSDEDGGAARRHFPYTPSDKLMEGNILIPFIVDDPPVPPTGR